MADKMYGLSPKEVEVLRDQAARRLANRQEYLKQVFNPHRHATAGGGHLFDPAIQRFLSMQVSHLEHFKVNAKTSLIGVMLTIVPMGLFAWALYAERESRLEKYRTGQVAYRDRGFKLI